MARRTEAQAALGHREAVATQGYQRRLFPLVFELEAATMSAHACNALLVDLRLVCMHGILLVMLQAMFSLTSV